MGLSQCEDRPVSATGWWFVASLFVLAILMQLAGSGAAAAMRFERQAIGAGEFWRLLSGHVVHLGWSHLLLNLAGLGLVWLLIGPVFGVVAWILISVVIILFIDAGLWFLQPQLEWYVGLSGLLHGLLLAGLVVAVADLPARRKEAGVLLLLLLAKLGYEQLLGAMPGSTGIAGGTVIVDAHLYGAIGGLVASVVAVVAIRKSHNH